MTDSLAPAVNKMGRSLLAAKFTVLSWTLHRLDFLRDLQEEIPGP